MQKNQATPGWKKSAGTIHKGIEPKGAGFPIKLCNPEDPQVLPVRNNPEKIPKPPIRNDYDG